MPWRRGATLASPGGTTGKVRLGGLPHVLLVGERGKSKMGSTRLVSWSNLPEEKIHTVFPDATRLGVMKVEFSSTNMHVYRFRDAAGNEAFAFGREGGAVSHGSQILDSNQIGTLRSAGADVGNS